MSDLDARVAWQGHVGRGPDADLWYEAVLDRYREAHRHYHDVRHVTSVVGHVVALSTDIDVALDLADPDAVVAAAFFHDVIYDPRASDNESASARLAEVALGELGWDRRRIETVVDLVLGTAHHRSPDRPGPVDQAVLDAADLSVLAAEPAGYADYVRDVRREYDHVDDAAWTTGRSAVMRGFLERRTIYAPRLALDAWERRARANITVELEML